MGMNDFQIGLVAGLDGTKSKQQLNNDIDAIKKQLSSIEIQAKLDQNVISNITKQLNSAQVSLRNVTIDQSAINKMVSQINNSLNSININLGTGINANSAIHSAQRTGQQIGRQIQNGVQSVIQKSNFKTEFGFSANNQNNVAKQAQKYFQGISNGIVTVQEKMHDFDGDTSLKGFTVNIKNAQGEIESLNYALRKLYDDQGNVTGQIFKYTSGSINDNGATKFLETSTKKADELSIRLEKIRADYSDLNHSDPIKNPSNISNLAMQYSKVENAIDNVRNADVTTYQSMVSNANKEISTLDTLINQYRRAENVKSQNKSTDITSELQIAANNFEKFKTQASGIQEMSNTVNQLETALKSVNDAASLNKFTDQLRVAKSELAKVTVQERQFVTEYSRINKANSMQKWADNNTKAMKKYGEKIEEIIAKMKNLDVAMTKEESESLTKQMAVYQNKSRSEGLLGNTTSDKLKNAWEKFGGWSLATGSLMQGVYAIKQAVSELKNVDDILTEISKTSDLTTNQIKNLGSESFDTASKYGKTASDYLTGVQEMYRAGFDNAEQMSELSILAQSAGDMDTKNANDYLIATNAAYDYKGSVEELNKVLDSQNYITNNAAVSMQDMADATSEAASIAAQYGVKVDELSSLIAVAVSKTRESGSEVGTAIKALLINLQNTTSNPIKKAFEDVGISMTKMVGDSEQLKTPIELLKELSKVYNELPEGDTKRANILNKIGGKYHANTLAAILSDQDTYNSMMSLYNSDSAVGSAQQEADKSANNWTGTLNKLSNSWSELVSKFAESDSIVTVLNLVNDLTQSLSSLVDISSSANEFFSGGFLGLDSSSVPGTLGNIVGLVQSLTGLGEKIYNVLRPSL